MKDHPSTSGQLRAPVRKPDAPPAGIRYSIDRATAAERERICMRNRSEGRQIMNLTVNPSNQLFVLKDLDNSDLLVGWCGLDLNFDPRHPESFSCYLAPDYRRYNLWLVLEHARCLEAQSRGVRKLFVRMAESGNRELLEKRRSSGFYRSLERSELTPDYLALCQRCNLYGTACTSQAYLELDTDRMLDHVHKNMGLTDAPLPRFVELKKEQLGRPFTDSTSSTLGWMRPTNRMLAGNDHQTL